MLHCLEALFIDSYGAVDGWPAQREGVFGRIKDLQVLIVALMLLDSVKEANSTW